MSARKLCQGKSTSNLFNPPASQPYLWRPYSATNHVLKVESNKHDPLESELVALFEVVAELVRTIEGLVAVHHNAFELGGIVLLHMAAIVTSAAKRLRTT